GSLLAHGPPRDGLPGADGCAGDGPRFRRTAGGRPREGARPVPGRILSRPPRMAGAAAQARPDDARLRDLGEERLDRAGACRGAPPTPRPELPETHCEPHASAAGTGIVGPITTVALRRDGHDVTLIGSVSAEAERIGLANPRVQ